MIELTSELCQELGLSFWQLNTDDATNETYRLNRDELELLRKILSAKSLNLQESQLQVLADGVAIVQLSSYRLIFKDVGLSDTKDTIYLSKITDMINSPEEKKRTWYKLKDLLL